MWQPYQRGTEGGVNSPGQQVIPVDVSKERVPLREEDKKISATQNSLKFLTHTDTHRLRNILCTPVLSF